MIDSSRLLSAVRSCRTLQVEGRVTEMTGIIIKACIPGIETGELCLIGRSGRLPLPAEVVGFRDDLAFLMPLGNCRHISPMCPVRSTGLSTSIRCGSFLLGQVLDVAELLRDSSRDRNGGRVPLDRDPPAPMMRKRITRQLRLGVRSLDVFVPVGEGQRLGVFAAAGTGKSTLLGMIARGADVDVNVVALIGERGREVREFVEDNLGEKGMQRSVVVVATSDAPALVRLKAAFAATAIAEYFRDQGLHVLLMMDSVTRFARAQREIGLAIGEPPARGGYTPSVFSTLPRLLERAGNSERGSITGLYTVLVAGDDLTEPVADEVMSILDGHIILSRRIAGSGIYPAVDLLLSKSRILTQLVSGENLERISTLLELLALHEENRDAIAYGIYRSGANDRIDQAIRIMPPLLELLRQQNPDDRCPAELHECFARILSEHAP